MGKIRVLNDLRLKYVDSEQAGRATLRNGKRIHCIAGISTRKYYDSSYSSRYNIPGIRMDKLVSFAHLAICLYNIKERTNFGQVKLLKVVESLGALIGNHITFQAFAPLGGASVFEAVITEQRQTIKIKSVWIKPDHSNHNAAENPSPPQQCVIKTLSTESLKDLAPYLSQCALAMYNDYTLHVKKDAVHDIPSLKVVKAVRLDAEQGNTYLVTFEASLRDETKNVETFETQISVPTLLPTTTMKFKETKIIKHD